MFSKTKLNIKLAALLGILIIFLPPLWRAVVLGLGSGCKFRVGPGIQRRSEHGFPGWLPHLIPDGLHLYMASNRPSGVGVNNLDIWVAERYRQTS